MGEDAWPPIEATLQLCLVDWTQPSDWKDRKALGRYMAVHVAYIRSLVPPDKLLEFHPRDGWDPLCRFLGKPSPADEPFPFANKGENAANLLRIAMVFSVVRRLGPYVLAVGVGVFAWRWVAN
ncbi:hypothetical protein HYALB_00001607 [Hymenoscyphus albidus]|uniref:Uncharacterized protein n=1 Tax=Hymenoscyphus albidus TaxID=595503 RepID=A0A9N9L900_9HELO|nr:hypothetical protein HYALB_00001607 [Hymenoscyphus albidus]